MKCLQGFCIASFLFYWIVPVGIAQDRISVSGKNLIGPCGDTLLLKGINYAPYNWGWSPNQLRINELAKTKANCIRLVWYKTGETGTPNATYANLVLLDSTLARCVRFGLIPIVVLHDQTCQNSPAALTSLSSWFTQSSVLQLIIKYQHSLILNLANEALYVNWTGNPVASKAIFQNTYAGIIANLRAAGIHVPLMIDGPDCGTNLEVLAQVGPSLLQIDPDSNLIFSAHAYWYSYAGNDSTQMAAKINLALAANIPFVFGEVANQQDDVSACQYNLNFKPLLRICKQKKIGWLAWSWDNDICPARQISNAGQFSSLSSYGQEMVYSPEFGLFNDSAAKSQFLISGGCFSTESKNATLNEMIVYPNPNLGTFRLLNSVNQPIGIVNTVGLEIPFSARNESGSIEIKLENNIKPGLFLLLFEKGRWVKVQVL